MSSGQKKIFLITGESSGEQHAASLVSAYRELFGKAEFSAIGSSKLSTEGVKIIFDYRQINFVGFTSVLRNYFFIKKKFRETLDYIKKADPDCVVLVDFPGFNLRIARSLRKFYTGKIIYYIAPQLWAWHKGRIKIIKRCCDKLIVVFPFEVEFFRSNGVDAFFTGNPVKNKIDNFLSDKTENKTLNQYITLLPGSRIEEIKNILPVFLEAAFMLKNKFGLSIKLLHPTHVKLEELRKIINGNDIEIVENKSDEIMYSILLNSRLVFTKAGTSSMECALLGVPFCTGYRTNSLNYFIGKRLATVKYMTMANILLGEKIINEFIQNDLTPENLIKEGERIITDEDYRQKIINNLKKIQVLLTDKKASENAAKIIHDLIC